MARVNTLPAPPVVVELFDISLGYGKRAEPILTDVNFSVRQGQFLVIVGPSGVGKSSLLRVVSGLIEPQKGDVYVQPQTRRESRALGFVFQDPLLLPWRRVLKNVELGLEGLISSRAERRERALEALSLVGLESHARKWPNALSGGERQRVGIARALAVQPSLLLMDEPFGALDPGTREALQDELLAIWEKTGTSVMFITHDMHEATYLGDRVIVLGGKPATIVHDILVDEPRPRLRTVHAEGDFAGFLYKTFNSKR